MKKVVCLGGGIGTVNLIKGLKQYPLEITVVLSMADEGGSSGRLRRLYQMFPPGDLVSCMAAMKKDEKNLIPELLTYRFPGDRYDTDTALAGHKLGNLIMVALRDIGGDFNQAIKLFQKLFDIPGVFLPATVSQVSISAKTSEGKLIHGEENIDLGKYNGERVLSEVFLHPKDAKASSEVINAIKNADVIIAGPGDLYTTILPVLLVSNIAESIKISRAKKFFVVNVANKPFETKGYAVSDYIDAVKKHLLGSFPFATVVINNNYQKPIPKKFKYTFVMHDKESVLDGISVLAMDLIDEQFPIYHDPQKLAKAITENI